MSDDFKSVATEPKANCRVGRLYLAHLSLSEFTFDFSKSSHSNDDDERRGEYCSGGQGIPCHAGSTTSAEEVKSGLLKSSHYDEQVLERREIYGSVVGKARQGKSRLFEHSLKFEEVSSVSLSTREGACGF